MHLTVFAVAIVLSVSTPTPTPVLSAQNRLLDGSTQTEQVETVSTMPPEDTFNEFLPEDRSLGECVSALPKPGCGSEARGGWRQGVILLAILAALSFIAWRVVSGARLARVSRTPNGTTVPDDRDGDREP